MVQALVATEHAHLLEAVAGLGDGHHRGEEERLGLSCLLSSEAAAEDLRGED